MLLLAALAAATTPTVPTRATVRIVQPARITRQEWERSRRRREIMMRDDGRAVLVRLIEFE